MMVAGIGCRKGVAAEEVLAAINATLAAHRLLPSDLSALATVEMKRDEDALFEAARKLELPLRFVGATALKAASPCTLTHSEASIAAAGTPSVSEAAALAAAGPGARLLGPRTIIGHATCAIARSAA